MNRIISEELYERLLRCSDYENVEDTVGFYQETHAILRNAPILQPPSGQVGEVFTREQVKDALYDLAYDLMEKKRSRAKAERFADEILATLKPIDALRTLPQAPVVEVPSVEELMKSDGLEELFQRGSFRNFMIDIHALLQSKGGLKS